MRSIREQPFCWQEKSVFKALRKTFQGAELVKMRCLYDTITEIDNDFNGKEIKFYTKTIHTYSGLSKDWIPKGLKQLENLGIIKIVEDREKGKFKGKKILFTQEMPLKTVPGKTVNGKSINGKPDTSEENISLEENTYLEKNNTLCRDFSRKSRLNDFCFNISRKILDFVCTKKNIKINNSKIATGAKAIRLLIERDLVGTEQGKEERVGKALNWLLSNYDDQFTPVVESGTSFREKFTKIENQMKRRETNERSEEEIQAHRPFVFDD